MTHTTQTAAPRDADETRAGKRDDLTKATHAAAELTAKLADGVGRDSLGFDKAGAQSRVEALLIHLKRLGVEPRRPEEFGE